MRKHNLSNKVLLSLGALGSAGAIAGLGTFATFTSTTTASQTATAGKVVIALGASGAANRMSVNATNIVPGDTISRDVDLINSSSEGLSSVSLATTATTSSVLDTDTTNGLKMHIQSCSLAGGWTETGVSPAFVYTCPSGTITDVLGTAASPVTIVQTGNITPLTAITGSGTSTDHLLVVVTLPVANTAANLATPPSSTILYTFTGTQRTATVR